MKLLSFTLTIVLSCLGCTVDSKQLSEEALPSLTTSCGDLSTIECEMFVAINGERTKAGAKALALNSTCTSMARDHAIDMFTRAFFSHDSPTETFRQRSTRYGLSSGWIGENIAKNSNVSDTLSQWMNSAGHKANILSENYRATGIGFYKSYWVQCFTSMGL